MDKFQQKEFNHLMKYASAHYYEFEPEYVKCEFITNDNNQLEYDEKED